MAFKKYDPNAPVAPFAMKLPPERVVTATCRFSADQRFDMRGNVVFTVVADDTAGRRVCMDRTLSPDPTEAEMAPWRAIQAGHRITVRGTTVAGRFAVADLIETR